MPEKKVNRDYPLSSTPEPKVNFYAGGRGSDKEYQAGVGAQAKIYKGLSVGVDKFYGKNDYGKGSNTSYNVSLTIPLGRRNKNK